MKKIIPLKKQIPFEEKQLKEYLDFTISRANSLGDIAEKYQRIYYQGDEAELSPINKLFGEINSIASLIYTPEKILIDIVRADGRTKETTPSERQLLDALKEKLIHNFYTYHELDVISEVAVRDAIITGYTPVKVYWKQGGVKIKQIENKNFAVVYENIPIDDPQQIIMHRTYLTTQMIKLKYGISIPETISPEIKTTTKGKIFVTAKEKSVADLTQSVEDFYLTPVSYRGLQEVYELWINEYPWTGKDLWHRFEILGYNRQIVNHEISTIGHPFFIIRPYVLSNSVYGFSIISIIKAIQQKRTQRLNDISALTDLLMYPPLLITGQNVSKEQLKEDVKQLWTPGGWLVIQDPQGKIQPAPPAVNLQSAYSEIEFYDAQIRHITGLHEIVLGERATGTRATGMATLLAQFASAPFQRIASRLQAQLEEIFTYTAKLFQINDNTPVKIGDKFFYFSTIPFDFKVEIKSASISPIQLQTHIKLAYELFLQGWFPPDIFVDLIDLPYSDKIKAYMEEQMQLKAQQALIEGERKEG